MDAGEVWRRHFGDLPPVGYVLRAALPNRWLRIHSLPGSKRYPETDAEYSTMLERHNQAASEILGFREDAIFFVHVSGADDFPATFAKFEWVPRTGLLASTPVRFAPVEGDDNALSVAGCMIPWTSGVWNDLLRDVADDRVSSVLLANPTSGEVYAPYDGGADLFVTDSQRVATLRLRWSSWLSRHPEGL
jgi:hypothetical protein